MRIPTIAVSVLLVLTGCTGAESGQQVGEDLPPWPAVDSPSPIDGRYQVDITDADLEAAGVPESYWLENHGTYTWEIADGLMAYGAVADNPQQNPHEVFHLTLRGEQAMLMSRRADGSPPTNNNVLWMGTWSRDHAGTLRFSDQRPGLDYEPPDRALWFAKEFTPLR